MNFKMSLRQKLNKFAGLLKIPEKVSEEMFKYVSATFCWEILYDIDSYERIDKTKKSFNNLKNKLKKYLNHSYVKDDVDIYLPNGEKFKLKIDFLNESELNKVGQVNHVGGEYEPLTNTIRIYILDKWFFLEQNSPHARSFETIIDQIKIVINHELGHVIQFNSSKKIDLSEDKTNYKPYSVNYGLPPKVKNKKYDELGYSFKNKEQLIHELRDIEFYPRLRDSIAVFNKYYWHYNKEVRMKLATLWVGINESDHIDPWFKILQKHNPKKWKKATKEFLKRISDYNHLDHEDSDFLDKIKHSANEFKFFNSDSEEDKRIVAGNWVGLYNNMYAYSQEYWRDPWFINLKSKNFKKWERACELFFKIIGINLIKKEAGLLSIPKSLYENIYQYAKRCYLTVIDYDINNNIIENLKENDKLEIKNYIKQNLQFKEDVVVLEKYEFLFEDIFYYKEHAIIVKCTSSSEHLAGFIYPEKKSMNSEIVIGFHPGVMQATTSVKAIKIDLEDLKDTVRHELQHFMQKFIMKNKSLNDFGGLPSKRINNPESKYDSDNDIFDPKVYLLQDEEFYPQLTNSISLFRFKFGNLPLKEKYLAAKHWVGENVDLSSIKKKVGKPSNFFIQLKNNNFEKWKKAVKEFFKYIAEPKNKILFNE